jgi:nitrogen fixation/metabolism regulation signal transduction histidine kinase
MVFAQTWFNLTPFLQFSESYEVVLAFTLSTFIFLVLLVFGFVLLRTLVKVWLERKQQKPGSKFKTSLVTSLIVLTLIPAISLFAFAYGLVNRSIDKWFSGPVDNLFRLNAEADGQWREERRAMARTILGHLAAEPPTDLEAARIRFGLISLQLVDPDNGIATDSEAEETVRRVGLKALGNQDDVIFSYQTGLLGARRVHGGKNERVLLAVFPPPAGIDALQTRIAKESELYGNKDSRRRFFRDTSVLLLTLMTVLVLFAAVWVGLSMSKRITLPIEALSEATREISAGNLGYRVTIQAGDELGMLVSLFNDMAGRLQDMTREGEARRRYIEVILENIPSGVISVDTDLRVHTLNRAARTMFSIDEAAHLSQIFGEAELRELQALMEEAGETSVTRELSFTTPGRPAHSAVTASRLETGGYVLVVEDLTEFVRAQKASAWREVARRLAHEIKNPLTPIQLSAERIARNLSRLPAPSPRVGSVIQECVAAIVDEVSSLKNLVDEFVRFARLPAVARGPASIGDLVDRTLALYEGRLEGIEVAVDIPKDFPEALIDVMQMKRVLVNLIDNALEALEGEPQKSLRIICGLTRGGSMARLTIEDTGRGVAPEDRERLFKPYFSTRKNGFGLGLAIVSRVVADHGGYIDVEPNAPRGTRFIIELPLCLESSLSTTNRASASR